MQQSDIKPAQPTNPPGEVHLQGNEKDYEKDYEKVEGYGSEQGEVTVTVAMPMGETGTEAQEEKELEMTREDWLRTEMKIDAMSLERTRKVSFVPCF